MASVLLAGCAAPSPPPSLGAPIACDPGVNCWVSTFFDHDPGPGRKDHACGPLTHNKHYGTGFAITNLLAMEDGVPVVAAAGGTVTGTRDGMPDINRDDVDPVLIDGKECGNGLRIAHGNGWATQYCHLKSGSLAVSPGQRVAAGQALGQVGLSGNTQHPHVFLGVFKDGERIDPYTGAGLAERACGDTSGSLWNDETARAFPYRTGLIRDAFFTHGVPDIRDAKDGTAARDSGPTDLPELVLWARTIGTLPDHSIAMTIRLPGGLNLVRKVHTNPKLYAAVGVRARRARTSWFAGTYSGLVEIRNGKNQIVDRKLVTIDLQ